MSVLYKQLRLESNERRDQKMKPPANAAGEVPYLGRTSEEFLRPY
jgi:hypothetical protein